MALESRSDSDRVAVAVRLAVVGFTVSLAGDEVLRYLLLVSASNHSLPVSVGLIGLALAAPSLLAAWLGAVVDRLHGHALWLMIAAESFSFVVTLILLVLWSAPAIGLLSLVLGFLLEVAGTAVATSWQAAVPEFYEEDPTRQRKLVSWTSAGMGIGPTIGPTMAAILFQFLAPQGLLAVEAGTFAFAAIALVPSYLILRRIRQETATVSRAKSSLGPKELVRGAGLVLGNPLVRAPVISLSIMNIITSLVTFGLPLLLLLRGYSTLDVGVALTVMSISTVSSSFLGAAFSKPSLYRISLGLEPLIRGTGLLVATVATDFVVVLVGLVLLSLPQGIGRVARSALLAGAFTAGSRGVGVGGYRLIARAFVPFAPLLLVGVVNKDSVEVLFLIASAGMAIPCVLFVADASFGRALLMMSRREAPSSAAMQY